MTSPPPKSPAPPGRSPASWRALPTFAVAPALITVVILLIYVREPGRHDRPAKPRLTVRDIGRLPRRYWLVVALGGVFTLARFSEAFLVLRAQDVGLDLRYVPLVMIVMNLLYAGAAYPAGVAADHMSARTLLLIGLGLLIAADLVLAAAASAPIVLAGAALWGLHMGFSQGLLSKLVADAAPADLVGTGFGVFNLVSGGALLFASLIAGSLWSAYGAPATFLAGAGFTTLAAIGLLVVMARSASRSR
jgi:predicted MFS family arabinose efflux permease